jgi:hypothetical protein
MPRKLFAATLLFALALGGGSAHALDAAKVKAIASAADAFETLAKDSSKTGNPPRQTDGSAKALLDLVFDVSELQTGTRFEMTDLANLNAWQLAILKVGGVYVLAGPGAKGAGAPPTDQKSTETINQNTGKFAPEMGRYVDAQLWVQGAMIDTMSRFLANAPIEALQRQGVRDSIAQTRAGLAKSLNGVIVMFLNQGVDDNWRRDRLPALAALGFLSANFLLPEDARIVRNTALEVANRMKDPATQASLRLFATTVTPR